MNKTNRFITIMRKTTCIAFVFAFSSLAAIANSQNAKVKIDKTQTTIEKVIEQIEEQTDYLFVYSRNEINTDKEAQASRKETTVKECLDKALTNTDISYSLKDNYIVLNKADKKDETQQTKKVSGVVLDNLGVPIIGAYVVVKDAVGMATITDMNGKFSLEVDNNEKLLISYIGYITQEISILNKKSLNIILKENTKVLEELVVVGYGAQKKESLTGAVSAIRGDDLITTKNENVVNMLTGKLPGVQIKQNSMEPGSNNSNIQIRGMGSPLIIIDGMPRDNMAKLDANEIESISVLKDGSAAIYGVRAANGVILIKTKRGTDGKVEVNYSGTVGAQQLTAYPETLSGWEYMTLTNEHSKNKGGDRIFSDDEINEYKSGEKESTDWGRSFVKDIALQTQHNINLRGGGKKVDYFVSFGYLNQGGHYKSNDLGYERFNLRSNVGVNITKDLRAEVLINGTMDAREAPNYPIWQIHHGALMHIPTIPLYANGNPAYLQNVPGAYNPLAMIDKDISGYQNNYTNLVQTAFELVYTVPFVKGLTARAKYGYDYYNWEQKHFKKEYTLYDYDKGTDTYIGSKAWSPSVIRRNFEHKKVSLLQFMVDYRATFADKHSVSGLLLYEENTSEMDNFSAQREFSIDALDQLFAGNTTNQQATQNANNLWHRANKSLAGKFMYDYMSKYFAEFAFRYDGSSMFAPGKQWGLFPSVSAAWRVSEEGFFKNTEALSFVNNLKIRATYGRMGDDSAASYQYLSGYTYPSGGYVLDDAWVNAIKSKGAPNPDITWFTAENYNVGLDAEMWHGLLGVQFDYFTRKRDGLLAYKNLTLPGTVGIGLPQENLESDETKGYEVVLSHRNKINDLSYSISGNISYARTSWKYKERAESGNSYDNWRNNSTDRPNNIWWGYGSDGQYTSMDDIWSSSIQDGKGNSISRPGDYKYEDWNEDGIIDGNDIRPIATKGYPLVNYGVTLAAEYKNFDLSLLFQGASGMSVKYAEQMEFPLLWDRGGLAMFMDRWHMANPDADPQDPNTEWIPGNFPSSTRYAQSNNYDRESEFNVQNAAYLRLKNIELGYTFRNLKVVEKARVYFNGYNLLTFTGLEYSDPEQPTGRTAAAYPFSITYNLGVNLTF